MSKKEDYIKNIEGAERRFFESPVTIEKRVEGDEDKPAEIVGYAFKFNKVTTIGGWFREEILPGAADDVLNDDVRCLFNHNANLILARSVKGKGTLTLSVDNVGLQYKYVTPDRSYAKDLEDAINSGDVNQSSFSFKSKETIWITGDDNEPDLRQIKKFEILYDVSPVTYPAYQDTTVAKRSHDAFVAENTDVEGAEEINQEENRAETLDVCEAQYLYNKNNQ